MEARNPSTVVHTQNTELSKTFYQGTQLQQNLSCNSTYKRIAITTQVNKAIFQELPQGFLAIERWAKLAKPSVVVENCAPRYQLGSMKDKSVSAQMPLVSPKV